MRETQKEMTLKNNPVLARTISIRKKLIELGFKIEEIRVKSSMGHTHVGFSDAIRACQMLPALVAHGFQVTVFHKSEDVGAPVSHVSAFWHEGIVPCVQEY